MNLHLFKKCLWVIPISILCNLTEIISTILADTICKDQNANTFEHVFYGMVFGGSSIDKSNNSIVLSMFNLILPTVFNFLFGTFLYKDLCISSTYYFIRQRNRTKWYLKKTSILFFLTFFYTTIEIFIPFITAINNTHENINKSMLYIVISSLIALALFTFITTLLINILSITIGSALSFIIVYLFTIICFFLSLKLDDIFLFNKIQLSKFNLIDNTIIQWQSSNFDKSFSIAINVFYVVLLIILEILIINKTDISLVDNENKL